MARRVAHALKKQRWGNVGCAGEPRNPIRVYFSSGVSARTGNSYDLIGAAWQYR